MPDIQRPSGFRVIIVGGAIGGLTLAHCLIRENIDFVVLESHSDPAPQAGASIGILANGFRVLDQLGLFDAVFNAVEPLTVSAIWTADGKSLFANTAPKVLHERHGYPFSFLGRQTLLAALYGHLGESRSRVLLNKRVTEVSHLKDNVVVQCSDGSSYTGDLLVGADGVHSTVRQEMWRHMIDLNMEKVVQDEKNKMLAEYSCVFGMSGPTPGLQPGDCHRTFADKFSFLTVAGKDGKVYWFLFAKMPEKCSMTTMPKFTSEQRDAHVAQYMDYHVAGGVTFGSVYKRVLKCTYIPLEEAFLEHWFCGRIVCIGDAVHKMTPNLGQGANSAIESAASLTNHLSRAVRSAPPDTKPNAHQLQHFLLEWQKSRQPRAKEVWQGANDFTRLEAFATPFHKILAHYLMPHMGDKAIDMTSDTLVGGEIIESLGVPDRALKCSIPYNPQFERLKDDASVRALLAMPLLLCAIVAWYSGLFIPESIRQSLAVAIRSNLYSAERATVQYLLNYGITISIWTIEGYRHATSFTFMALPTLYTILSHFKGTDKVAPFYFFIYFLAFPIPKLVTGPSRQIKTLATNIILPILICTFTLPLLVAYTTASPAARSWSILIWQFFPVFIATAPQVFRQLTNSAASQTLSISVDPGLWNVRILYGFLITATSAIRFCFWLLSSEPQVDVIYQFHAAVALIIGPVSDPVSRALSKTALLTQVGTLIYLILFLRDAKRHGTTLSYSVAVTWFVILTTFVGPEVAIVAGWAVREEILVSLSQNGG